MTCTASAARLGDRERERRTVLSEVVVAGPPVSGLLDDELDDAWAQLRPVMAAIAVIAEVAPLPSLILAESQAEQPLATNVLMPVPTGFEPVTVDWHLVNGWRSAFERLREDASSVLPDM